jgi:hypothetical protein
MKDRITALIVAGVLQLAYSSAVFAQSPADGAAIVAPQLAFMLPINGTLGSAATPASTKFQVLDPMPEGAPAATPEALKGEVSLTAPNAVQKAEDGPIIIDNDEAAVNAIINENYKWEEIPDEQGKTHIQAGAVFPVSIMSEVCSKSAKVGDPITARLAIDLRIGGKLVASKGCVVNGHVSMCSKARRILQAELSMKRWWRPNGALGIQFDEIVNESGEHLPLVAAPAQRARIIKNKAEGRVLGVNHNGEIAAPLSMQLKSQAIHTAIRVGASAGGVFSFGAVPVAYGVLGAINPDFAFMHPVGKNVPHRRLKGFGMGVVQGLPGGFLIADTVIKGQEATIKPGDQFLAEFKQNFTGEPASEADLLPGATTKVHGQVVKDSAKQKDSKKK